LWIVFWAYIYLENEAKANKVLDLMVLDENTLNLNVYDFIETPIFGKSNVSTNEDTADESSDLQADKVILNTDKTQVKSLFEYKPEFSKLSINLFAKLVNKMYSIDYLIDAAIYNVTQIWDDDPINIVKTSEYGENYRKLSIMKEFLKTTVKVVYKMDKVQSSIMYHFAILTYESLSDSLHNEISKSQERERNRIMSNLSHSIKNMMKSIIDPLELIKRDLPEKTPVINNALKGASLIREIFNAINLSYKTTIQDLQYDISHPGNEAVTLESIIIDSIKYSISNMFDSKYFPAFMQNYFPNKEMHVNAKEAWGQISDTRDMDELSIFTSMYMFDLQIKIADVACYKIGNEKSSAIKLMILMQEIIFNAVKYTSYVPKDNRKINISLGQSDDKLFIEVSNTYDPIVRAKTTGVGKLIIENFATGLESEAKLKTENGLYHLSLQLNNYWR
jgi:signal transduction histidine kinase